MWVKDQSALERMYERFICCSEVTKVQPPKALGKCIEAFLVVNAPVYKASVPQAPTAAPLLSQWLTLIGF
jgi:hypothetical protein